LAMAGISLLGLLLKALPMFYQANWNIIAMCLPANAAIAYVAWAMTCPRKVTDAKIARSEATRL
jgi:hypothetical protein